MSDLNPALPGCHLTALDGVGRRGPRWQGVETTTGGRFRGLHATPRIHPWRATSVIRGQHHHSSTPDPRNPSPPPRTSDPSPHHGRR
uniref:Uncharacterized protein n=1 Tax=Triticum urartu TaxID=4572 RepID=A0A8R7P806_TRIUA